MFVLKLKSALRALFRSDIFTALNIIGLAISLGAIMSIFLYVNSELGTDRQFTERNNTYRIIRKVEEPNSSYQSPTLAGPFHEILSIELGIPKSEIVRVYRDDELVSYKSSVFFESNFLYVDSNFFQILDYPFQIGSHEKALEKLNSVVISERIAAKYFGDLNPIGEMLEIDGKGLLEVSAVLAKPKAKSHLDIDFVVNNGAMGYAKRFLTDMDSHAMTFYLQIPKEKTALISSNLNSISTKYLNKSQTSSHTSLSLQALPEIYFDKAMEFDIARHGNWALIQAMMAIAIILSLLVAANFINLTIAKLSKGVRKIGLKKILGSSKRSLLIDWAIELYLIILLAAVIGGLGSYSLLPSLMDLYGINLIFPHWSNLLIGGSVFTLLLTMLILLIPGLIFSAIPSFYALSGKLRSLKSNRIQHGLLFFQFVVAFVLIVFSVSINKQYQYMQEKELGLNDNQVLIFNSNNKHSWKNKEHIQDAISNLSGVQEVSMAYGGLPGSPTEALSYQIDNRTFQWNTAFVRPNLTELLDIRVLDGKGFDVGKELERQESVLLNARAATELGWPQESIIGKAIKTEEDSSFKRILGIVQDFHYQSFTKEIGPLVMQSTDAEETFVVKLEAAASGALLTEIEKIWQSYVPKYPFSYLFLDEGFQKMHLENTKQGKIIFLFTLLTLIIASIGTLSLSAFIQQLKVKEIAIRKVLGASIGGIIYSLSSNILSVLVLACLIASPLAIFVVKSWLVDFHYQIPLSPLIFILGYVVIILIVLFLIIGQSWRAATSNPIDSLKRE